MSIKTSDLEDVLKQTSRKSLSEVLKEIPESAFIQEFEKLRLHRNLSKSDVIRRSNIDRTYGYQILSGAKEPGKDRVLLLAIALNANLDETNRLLALSDNSKLYPKIKRDACILYAIENNYDVLMTNELLIEHKHNVLGEKL